MKVMTKATRRNETEKALDDLVDTCIKLFVTK